MRITPKEFDYTWYSSIPVQKHKSGNPKTKNRRTYKDIICAFDIETTRIVEIEQAVMYVWMFQFGEDVTVIGRTWSEFIDFVRELKKHTDDRVNLVVYVHNLSYEFQFLRGIYQFQSDEVFAVKPRKVLKCDMSFIELRCSYLHTNMSLSEFTSKMGAEHGKLSGREFDYTKRRFYWTELTEKELDYCCNDVQGLVESLNIEMANDGDNLYSIPLTSTGYVRRDAKQAMRHTPHNYMKNQLPDYRTYKMLEEAFRGGNTHANRYYAGQVLVNVHSADRSSSYPDVLCNCKFPVSKFEYVGFQEFEDVVNLIAKRGKAVLMRVSFTKIRLRDETWGCPYLTRDKSRNIIEEVCDNGRILTADYLETTLTDIDFRIILEEYEWKDCCTFEVAHAKYGRLPPSLIAETISYYRYKTELKDVDGQEVFYMKSKNKLNSIYGMMAQKQIRQEIDFINGEFKPHNDDEEILLDKANKKAFLNYAWGVWTTAWSRLRLEEGIRLAHGEHAEFVYCDTDSVKYLGEIDWNKYNEERIKDSLESGAYATDPHGVTHYMGVYEREKDMTEFATLGAKKYCYRYEKVNRKTGEIEYPLITTIAGVSKASGGVELEKHGGIGAFKPGFIFHDAGGTESIYNDSPEITQMEIDGHIVHITSNVVIKDSTYTLGITGEYERLLKKCRNIC